MRGRLMVGTLALGLTLLVGAAPAVAQPTGVFSDLGLVLNVGDRVRVEDQAGVRYEGTVRALAPATLVVAGPEGPRTFTAETVAKVQRRGDPIRTGALLGFGAGYLLGAQFIMGLSDHAEPLSTFVIAGGLVGTAGAGLGALLDSLHDGLTDVYVAERPVAVTVGPMVGGGRIGVAAGVRW